MGLTSAKVSPTKLLSQKIGENMDKRNLEEKAKIYMNSSVSKKFNNSYLPEIKLLKIKKSHVNLPLTAEERKEKHRLYRNAYSKKWYQDHKEWYHNYFKIRDATPEYKLAHRISERKRRLKKLNEHEHIAKLKVSDNSVSLVCSKCGCLLMKSSY